MPNYKPVLGPGGAPLLDEFGVPKWYDADLYPDGPPPSCCCGNRCLECFDGQPFTLCAILSDSWCEAWNKTFCLIFNLNNGQNCVANGFTITDECGTSLAGMGASWDGTTLCIRIADISGKLHEWCGQVTCAQIEAGVFLPETFGTGGGTMFVKFGGLQSSSTGGCDCDDGEALLAMMAQQLNARMSATNDASPQRLAIPTAKRPAMGPGTELKKMLEEIDAQPFGGCSCSGMAAQMDRWGVEGCREHRDAIVATLKENAAQLNLLQLVTMGANAASASWLAAFSPLDPFGSLVDEAIRRASFA